MNALSSARPAATLKLERAPRKLDTHRFTVDQLDLWRRLAVKADAVGIPPPNLNPDAALQEVLRSDELGVGSYDATRLRVTRGGLTPQEISHLVSQEARVLISDPWTHIATQFAWNPSPFRSSKLSRRHLLLPQRAASRMPHFLPPTFSWKRGDSVNWDSSFGAE